MTARTRRAPTVPAVVVRDFNDAGTERSFARGTKPRLERGVFDNYAAAGLVRAPDATSA